ncbi:hypothetical protein VCHC59A1_2794 [Vibrio cholerae HC-59A1]|nr:hypothetical protein VCHC59A1_2794 [Vibrio cholerae HC-59A1]
MLWIGVRIHYQHFGFRLLSVDQVAHSADLLLIRYSAS